MGLAFVVRKFVTSRRTDPRLVIGPWFGRVFRAVVNERSPFTFNPLPGQFPAASFDTTRLLFSNVRQEKTSSLNTGFIIRTRRADRPCYRRESGPPCGPRSAGDARRAENAGRYWRRQRSGWSNQDGAWGQIAEQATWLYALNSRLPAGEHCANDGPDKERHATKKCQAEDDVPRSNGRCAVRGGHH